MAVVTGQLAVALLPTTALANTAAAIAPSDPHAPTVNSGWQAGTCSEEKVDTGNYCSVATPDQFFERAAAHPNYGFTQFILRSGPGPLGSLLEPEVPTGELKDVRVDLPVGLSVNPSATVQCPLATFEAGGSGCPPASQVGESEITTSVLGKAMPPTAPLTRVPVYNVVPKMRKEEARTW